MYILYRILSLSFNFANFESIEVITLVNELIAKEYETTPTIIMQIQNIRYVNVPPLKSPYPTVVIVVIMK